RLPSDRIARSCSSPWAYHSGGTAEASGEPSGPEGASQTSRRSPASTPPARMLRLTLHIIVIRLVKSSATAAIFCRNGGRQRPASLTPCDPVPMLDGPRLGENWSEYGLRQAHHRRQAPRRRPRGRWGGHPVDLRRADRSPLLVTATRVARPAPGGH